MKAAALGDQSIRRFIERAALALLLLCLAGLLPTGALAQADQGTITGTITDPTGAIIPSATVTLTDTDTGLVLTGPTNKSGVYVFSPIKIGTYSVKAESKGFSVTQVSGLTLNVDQRLQANLKMQPGSVSETVTVSSTGERLLDTESSSTGQVVSAQVINDTPLNGRNYVFIAQLTAGVTQANGSRGAGNGDFDANGERAEQNNFVLDGVDNNSNSVDFLNGASYVVKPPPDALAEFKVQTSTFSAQFGHSAGAVINASIKSGTNGLHGDFWEYFRNDALDAIDYFAKTKPEFRQNQFGGTIGGPILKNKLFFFGDVEADRLVSGNVYIQTVPTALERQGNFSELLNTALSGNSQPVNLFEPGTRTTPLTCNGQQNVFCPNQINAIAQRVLNLYPQPNANNGLLYNNYIFNQHQSSNTVQWDGRVDWNPSDKDQSFFRMSYYNTRGNDAPPLGTILDGGYYGGTGNIISLGENFALSETHEFSPTLSNEARFGYNFGHFEDVQSSGNTDVAAQLGLGGIPYTPGNGGLPATGIEGYGGVSYPGTPNYYPSSEYENTFQILDNVTKVKGNNTLKFGVQFQHVRFSTLQPPFGHGQAIYSGFFTSNPNQNFTGSGTADYLADEQASGQLSPFFTISNARWYSAAYFQDDWKALPKLTLNLGLRYDFYEPTEDRHDNQALFTPTSLAPGAGTGIFLLPRSKQSDTALLAPAFLALAAQDNLSIQYTSNRSLQTSQYKDFSPRIGFAFQPTDRSVIRGGFGIFFGGLESVGAAPDLSQNYPFAYTSQFTQPNCPAAATICPTDGISLNTGYQQALTIGLNNFVQTPGLEGANPHFYSPYAEQYNLTTQYALTHNLSVTVGYVGNVSRHLENFPDQNAADGLIAPGLSSQAIRPFPEFGGSQYDALSGVGSYNSGQVTLEKRTSSGLYFLTTYTYGHAMDNAATPLNGGAGIYRNPLLIPASMEYANSDWDVRQRYTFNGDYALPFGKGRRFMNHGGVLNEIAGQWSTDLVFTAQTGNPVTIGASNSNGPNGGGARRAFRTGDPFHGGGAGGCPQRVRTLNNWYNPCSFTDPLSGNLITNGLTNPLRDFNAAIAYLGPARNQTYGPGYERINLSAFKNFDTIENQYLQFRADIFNLFNTPAFGQPNGGDTLPNSNQSTNGGQITSTRSLGAFTPNPRFFQFALKYYF